MTLRVVGGAPQIPDHWSIRPFEELVFFQEGPGIRNWQYVDAGIPFVNIRCLTNGRLDTSAMSHVATDEALGRYRHFLLDPDDYVVSSSGTLGRIATVRESDLPCMLNTSVIRMRPRSTELDRSYLKFFLLSDFYQRQIKALATGSAQLNYGPAHLRQMYVVVPPLSEQRAIAAVLGAFDEKIEVNRRMSAIQEAVAQTLFRSWFVDFDPVRAPPDGIKHAPEALKGVFPSLFETTDGVKLPSGWRLTRLGDHDTFPFVPVGIDAAPDSEIRYIATADVQRSEVVGETPGKVGALPSRASMRPGGGRVWFAKMKASPKVLWTMSEDEAYWSGRVLSTGFAGLEARERSYEAILYCFISSQDFDATKNALATGTTMQALNNATIGTIPLVYPTSRVAAAFDEQVRPMFRGIWARFFESQVLTEMRNLLLPKLVQGEIDLRDAEALVESTI